MPRNEAKPLSENDAYHQRKVWRALESVKDYRDVGLTYIKRDGTTSRSAGKVLFFNGRIGFDTGSVTLDDPAKGQRTINLHRVTKVE
jgi:hypothetical protein